VGGSRETSTPSSLAEGLLLAPADLSAHASYKRYCTCLGLAPAWISSRFGCAEDGSCLRSALSLRGFGPEGVESHLEYNRNVVATTHTTKLTRPKADPHLQVAGERVKAAAEELERLGIADADGKRVHTELPTDMRDGVDRDFGG